MSEAVSGGDPVLAALRGDRERYLSALYAPEPARAALIALYAFHAETASVRDRVSQPLTGEIRLQWWRDALVAGAASTGNPVADRLIAAIDRYRLPTIAFERYLEARIFDLYDDAMPSRTDLEGYCGETSGAILQLAAMILDPTAAPAVADLAGRGGCAQGIIAILRLLPKHRARGQCYVPLDVLEAAGTTRSTFLAEADDPADRRVVAMMAALAGEHLRAFEHDARDLPQTLRPAFLPLALVPAYLKLVEGRERDVLRRGVQISDLRRHWRLLRTAARGWR